MSLSKLIVEPICAEDVEHPYAPLSPKRGLYQSRPKYSRQNDYPNAEDEEFSKPSQEDQYETPAKKFRPKPYGLNKTQFKKLIAPGAPKKNKDSFKTLFSTAIGKAKSGEKRLTLKCPVDNEEFVMVDIRLHFQEKPSRLGVCLTSYEYDWLIRCLTFGPTVDHDLNNKDETRQLKVRPDKKTGWIDVLQELWDKEDDSYSNLRARTISLNKEGVALLINDFPTYLEISVVSAADKTF